MARKLKKPNLDNARARRRVKRAAVPVTTQLLSMRIFGLKEKIRKAHAGIGGAAQGPIEEKVRRWQSELSEIEQQLAALVAHQ